MAVYKTSNSGLLTRREYTSFLAGNDQFIPFAPSGAYDSIATANGTGASGVITFSSIPSTYKHLQIRVIGLQASAADVFIKINANNGVGHHYLQGQGASAGAGFDTSTANGSSFGTISWNSTHPTVNVCDFLDYTDTNKYKTVKWLGGYDANGSGRIWLGSVLFETTSAISSITFTSASSYTTTSQFALYGIKGA